ncbi:MAG: alpha/beta hydrolase [Anaerolineae bacterium]|nr:alpha/beta hydrolase [Anaerolineae bacterium]
MAPRALQGHHVNYKTEGNGPPVILVHGMGGSLHHWDYLFPELVSHRYEVFSLDLLGHGESAKPNSNGAGYHVDAIYAHLANWISRLDLHTAPIMIGHALGAYLILTYALRNPGKVRGMVLANPYFTPKQLSFPMRFPVIRPKLSAKILTMAPKWTISSAFSLTRRNGEQFSREIRERLVDDVKRSDPTVFTFASTTRDLSSQLNRIKTKTLVAWGENDPLFNSSYYPQLVEVIPEAVNCPIPGSHHIHLTSSRLFNNSVIKFLEQLSGGIIHENPLSESEPENAS